MDKFINLYYQKSGNLSNKKFLIIIPAGDNSYHIKWYNSSIYDLCVIYFGNNDEISSQYKTNSDLFFRNKGPKWQLIRYVINKINIDNYKYIWLPDDDLDISKSNIEELFKISLKYKLNLSQPSLNVPNVKFRNIQKSLLKWDMIKFQSSKYIGWRDFYNIFKNDTNHLISEYISFKILLQKYPSDQKIIRYTNFIEIMCPMFEISFFKKSFFLIDHYQVQSGFGLDTIWSNMLDHKKMAVIDYIPVIHTRKVGNFQEKKTGNFKVLTINPNIETKLTFKRYGKPIKKFYRKTLKTITLGTPKIAFLFITKDKINYSKLWNKFFSKNNSRFNIYVLQKKKDTSDKFFSKYLLDEPFSYKFGNISVINAMNKLLIESIKDGSNQQFIFLNQYSIPFKNFDYIYDSIINNTQSIFSLNNGSKHRLNRFKYLINPDKYKITQNNFYKSDPFCILTRKHVNTILSKSSLYLYIFKKIIFPEEHFYVNIVFLNHGINSIIDKSPFFVYWKIKDSPYPHQFGPNLSNSDIKFIKNNINKNTFFAQKFLYDKDNNIEKFVMKLIKN
jgi:hypothetical protein